MKKLFCLVTVFLLLACGARADDARGSFRVEKAPDEAGDGTIIVLDEGGEVISLWTNEDVTFPVLDEIVRQGDCLVSRVIWTDEEMRANTVIALQAEPDETVPRFRVTAVNGAGERKRWYIAWSGKDSSPLLIPGEEAEAVLPVADPGLAETEARSKELEAILTGDYPLEECEAAAAELAALWEEERILLWGGYAMSCAEQRWEAERNRRKLAAVRGSEELPWYQLLLDTAEAALTRNHVYELLGKTAE